MDVCLCDHKNSQANDETHKLITVLELSRSPEDLLVSVEVTYKDVAYSWEHSYRVGKGCCPMK